MGLFVFGYLLFVIGLLLFTQASSVVWLLIAVGFLIFVAVHTIYYLLFYFIVVDVIDIAVKKISFVHTANALLLHPDVYQRDIEREYGCLSFCGYIYRRSFLCDLFKSPQRSVYRSQSSIRKFNN